MPLRFKKIGVYIFIVALFAVVGLYITILVSSTADHVAGEKIEVIENTKDAYEAVQDSLSVVIKKKDKEADVVIESLAKKVITVEAKAKREKYKLFKIYEETINGIDSLTDDSVSLAYAKCRANADSIFRESAEGK